ncbi:MAG: replication initiator protein [Microviridae sp.]|nr:MAG: replication initiator protein [Microviridae sp.]
MCLYPKLIYNRKYLSNKKNGGNPPPVKDQRTLYVPIGCGKCMECKKQRANNWRVRLMEDVRVKSRAKFVTMTFSEEALIELENEIHRINREQTDKLNKEHNTNAKYKPIEGYDLENEIATIAVRRFLERYRKQHKTSIKHWLVTELGQIKTERLHIHGIIWTQMHDTREGNILTRKEDTKKEIENLWKYGNVNKRDINWENNYVNEITVNYIVKYINKTDEIHKYYNPIILCSSGIGKGYLNRRDSLQNKYNGEKTKEYYTTRQGNKIGLPKYYRNKIYNDKEKEELWIALLNKEIRYVNGIKVDISQGDEDYNNIIKHAREENKKLGYGDNKINWDEKQYEQQRRNIQKYTRISKIKERKEKQINKHLRSDDMEGREELRTIKKRLAELSNEGTNELTTQQFNEIIKKNIHTWDNHNDNTK